MPLTDVEIRRAKAKEKAYRMSDGGSLFLWVTPAGGKLWRWAYTHEGKEKLMAFGKYPDVPLALARERHAEARRLLASGLDPMEQRNCKGKVEDGGNGLRKCIRLLNGAKLRAMMSCALAGPHKNPGFQEPFCTTGFRQAV